ncbi:MAG: CYTH domain-containing protein [Bacteroidales bacterium]|nr:CYTH domain-containing protein [Bacteroidales bacterium]
MFQEIERKFRVVGEFKHLATNCTHIQQGYISSGNGRTVRVRIRDEKGYLTIKGPSGKAGLSRFEWEKEISMEEATALMSICEPGIIDKHRYLVPVGNHTFEVDEFHGDNDGLVMAEVELGSEDEAYERPEWLGEEVTGDRRFYNSHMRKYPYKMWLED